MGDLERKRWICVLSLVLPLSLSACVDTSGLTGDGGAADAASMSGPDAPLANGDMTVPAAVDLATPMPGDAACCADQSVAGFDGEMALPDMTTAKPVECTFDDPSSLFDDCVVAQ